MLNNKKDITYEMLSSYILAHQFLPPSTMKSDKKDMVPLIQSIGGLQWGSEAISLCSRLHHFEAAWVQEAVETKALIEVHVLRGGLRIISPEDYPFYFAGTREVMGRINDFRLVMPERITDGHREILQMLSNKERMTFNEIKKKTNLPNSRQLINELLVAGKIIRAGRKGNNVLFDTMENWLPFICLDIEKEEGMLWMAKKYLDIYGPATASELGHWAGWTVSKAKEVLSQLAQEGHIVVVNLCGFPRYMLSHTEFPPREENPYLRILHNDDEIHLTCSGRCRELFGFRWKYKFSTTAVVLLNNNIAGEIKISKKKDVLYVDSSSLDVDLSMLSTQLEKLAKAWNTTLCWKK